MVQHACISIGIDRYQFFQPLSFAGADAQAMVDYFVSEEAWEPSKCLLITDKSTPFNSNSTYPNHQNIEQCLNKWCWEILQPGDFLWFFFSGYGININGNEYLMPLDGDPEAAEQTGISLTKLYRQFSAPGLDVMAFLDVNRSQGSSSGKGFGDVAAQLSTEFNIPTFLSCHSNEFSHEAANLKHGVFTAALIEALRFYPDLSIESLRTHLASRVPELSEHHWRPAQHPLSLVPDDGVVFRPIFYGTSHDTWISNTSEPVDQPELVTAISEDVLVETSAPTAAAKQAKKQPAEPDDEIILSAYQEPTKQSQSKNQRKTAQKSKSKIRFVRRTLVIGLTGAAIFAGSLFYRPSAQNQQRWLENFRNPVQLWQGNR
jgi:Caspase domain